LRERPDDIEALARHFLQFAAGEGLPRRQLTAEAAELLSRQPWRGNVRELKNFIYRLALLARKEVIDTESLVPMLEKETRLEGDGGEDAADIDAAVSHWLADVRPAPGTVYHAAMAAFERPLFAEVLKETGGN